MRPIKPQNKVLLTINHAGTGGEALTSIVVTIPIDANKYMDGVNLIECIASNLLPNVTLEAITQEIPQSQIDLIVQFTRTGRFGVTPSIESTANDIIGITSFLTQIDNAIFGTVELINGQINPNYTP